MKIIFILLISSFFFTEGAVRVKRKKDNNEAADDEEEIETLGMIGDKTFCSGKKQMEWAEALDFCHSYQMSLATIRDEDEQECVVKGMKRKKKDCLWLSAIDLYNERNWKWMKNYSKVKFASWEKGEDTNENTENNCSYIENTGKWFATSCSKDKNYPLCERYEISDDEK